MTLSAAVLGGAGLLVGCAASAQVAPIADGLFAEWSPSDLVATDPSGDASGGFDIGSVWARSDGTRLVVRFTTGVAPGDPELNLQSGSSSNGTIRLELSFPGGGSLTMDTRARRLYLNGNSGNTISWSTVAYHSAPTHSAREFEIQVDVGPLGVGVGDTIGIDFSGSDSLSSPAQLVIAPAGAAPITPDPQPDPNADFRIVALNTKRSGLISTSSRIASFERLIDGVDPAIVCFQEEYDSSASEIADFLEAADPLGTGATWSVVKNNDNTVAVDSSIAQLFEVPSNENSYAAAVVDFGGGDAVVVFSIHPKCCGYIGSSEDTRRIDQMQDLLTRLGEFRSASLGATLAPYASAPAIVIGDWNLVGSRVPIDLLEDPQGEAMVTLDLPGVGSGQNYTWIGSSLGAGAFTPGRLDLLSYSHGITPVRGFTLDTRELDGPTLALLGMQSADSGATDHLLLAADFNFGALVACEGDASGDGQVDFADVTSVLANWLGAGPAGDANSDGIVDFGDITSVLGNWLGNCS